MMAMMVMDSAWDGIHLHVTRQEKSALWTQFFPVSREKTHQRHGLMALLPEVQQLESGLEELLPQLVPGQR
jgi:hypothetical protein